MNPNLFSEIPFWSAPFGIRLLECIEYRKGITALDIGFGTGFPLIEIAMRLGEGATVYGIDPDREMLELVTRKLADLANPEIPTPNPLATADGGLATADRRLETADCRLIHGNAESLPLPSASIDLITSNNGINNAGDIPAVIAECARVIRPGGQFVQTMNTAETMIEFYRVLEAVLAERGMTAEIDAMRRHIAKKRPPVEWMTGLLEQNGFAVKEVIRDHFHYRFADGTAMLNHFFIRTAFSGPWKELVPEAKREEVFAVVEQRLNDLAAREEGLRMTVPFVVLNSYRRVE
ncbi:MAG TPA: class I SAM-dependent methyltransferase [Bacteroidales bacterium]|nr:class I SAM-dependent methyltransferase [Bacteroidales bacterium]